MLPFSEGRVSMIKSICYEIVFFGRNYDKIVAVRTGDDFREQNRDKI